MKKRSLFAARLVLVMLLMTGLLALTGSAAPDFEKELAGVIRSQQPAQDAYTEFLTQLPVDENGDCLYPATFGGAYMDSDTYMLCMALTDCSPEVTAEYDVFFSDPSIVNYVEVVYSYHELWELRESILNSDMEIVSICIDQEANVVSVGVPEANVEAARRAFGMDEGNTLPIEVHVEQPLQWR